MKKTKIFALVLIIAQVLSLCVFASDDRYVDVKTSRWSYDDIKYVSDNGLMNGVDGGKFDPAGKITRGMVVTVLHRIEGAPEQTSSGSAFTDVKAGKWYTSAVTWAQRNKIVNGVGDGKFAPNDNVTREQLAAIIMRYAEYKHVLTSDRADIKGYADYKKIHDYALDAMSWANAVGLITGVTDTTLNPRGTATREQFAAIIHRFVTSDFEYETYYALPTEYSHYTEPETKLVKDADVYVSTDGDDTADGSFEHPKKTFAGAVEAVREIKKTKTSGGITVAFMAGEYGHTGSLVLNSGDSGTPECPITYCAYGDGDVVFSAGYSIPSEKFVKVTGTDAEKFSPEYAGRIYKTSLQGMIDRLTTRNRIFSGSGICYEARYPNKMENGQDGCFTNMTTTYDENSILLQGMLPNIIKKFNNMDHMKVTGFLRTGWLVDTFPVKSYDPATNVLTFDFENAVFDNGYTLDQFPLAYEGRMDDTVFFSGIPNQLDTVGEYWFDEETKDLYVFEPDGDYAISEGLIFLTISPGCEYLTLRGLTFGECSETEINCFSDHINFENCHFRNIGGNGAISCLGTNFITVTGCEFEKFIYNGLMVHAREGDLHEFTDYGIRIENNYFHDYGLPEFFGCACHVGGSQCLVSHNEFRNGAHGAVQIAGEGPIDNVIEYNVFDNVMMTTEDFGAVYTGKHFAFRSNKIRYNLFMNLGNGARYGVYLDDYCSGQEVYGNIFYDAGGCAVVMNGGRDNLIHDNVIIDTEKNHPYISYGRYAYPEDEMWIEFKEGVDKDIPKEGDPMYDEWKDRWPILFNYDYDYANVGDVNCFFTTVNYSIGNYVIGADAGYGDAAEMFGVLEDHELPLTENPLFVCPALGDYRLRDDAPIPDIPFEKIGRY